jgi:sugar lactone lactonase YvrE
MKITCLIAVALLLCLTGCSSEDDDDNDAAGDDSGGTSGDDTDDSADDTSDDAADDSTPDDDSEAPLPVTPQVLVDGHFSSTEGIAFLPDGRLFVVGDETVSEVSAAGEVTTVTTMTHPVGMTGDGQGNLLVAEYGPTSCFDLLPSENDGSIVRVTPSSGAAEAIVTGIPDPNFIMVLPDDSFLVSDDCGHTIWRSDSESATPVDYLDEVLTPNGMVLSLDASEMYVCQSFAAEDSIVPDNRVWRVPVDQDFSPGTPDLLVTLPSLSTPDGGVLDEKGRLYVAASVTGTVWRVEVSTGEAVKVADGMPFVASLAFGRGGDFPETSLYATELYGGKVWKLDLGVRGAAIP